MPNQIVIFKVVNLMACKGGKGGKSKGKGGK